MTNALLKKCKLKEKLFHDYLDNRNPETRYKYTEVRNSLTSNIRKAKQQFSLSFLERFKGNMKKTWDFINLNLGRKTNQKSVWEFFKGSHQNPKTLADNFNNFFMRIGADLAENMDGDYNAFKKFIPIPNNNTFFLTPVSVNEIVTITRNFLPKGVLDLMN